MADRNDLDWTRIARVGARMVKPGPAASAAQIERLVDDLRSLLPRSLDAAATTARLEPGENVTQKVVDRPGLIATNAAMAAYMSEQIRQRMSPETLEDGLFPLQGRLIETAAGMASALVSMRILGQFANFLETPTLMLNAPTILAAQRRMNVNPHDFRMWVAVHEQTHRLQFANASWITPYLLDALHAYLEAEAAKSPQQQRVNARRDLLLGSRRTCADTQKTAAQGQSFEPLICIMTLLEGHAFFMMNHADRSIIRDAQALEAAYRRRNLMNNTMRVFSKALGFEAKAAQYRKGSAFCREIVRLTDVDTLNLTLTSPDTVPTAEEFDEPKRWLARVANA